MPEGWNKAWSKLLTADGSHWDVGPVSDNFSWFLNIDSGFVSSHWLVTALTAERNLDKNKLVLCRLVRITCLTTHILFEVAAFFGSHRICFRYKRNDVDFVVQSLHNFYIQRLQPTTRKRTFTPSKVSWGLQNYAFLSEIGLREGMTWAKVWDKLTAFDTSKIQAEWSPLQWSRGTMCATHQPNNINSPMTRGCYEI